MAQLWNSLPAEIPAIRSRASFSREDNHFLGATVLNDFFLLMQNYAMSSKMCKPHQPYTGTRCSAVELWTYFPGTKVRTL